VKNVGVSLALGLDPSLSENVELSLVLLGGPILSGHFKVGVAIVNGKKLEIETMRFDENIISLKFWV
jgi:hypothetical protein